MNIFEASIPLSAGIKVAKCLDSAATFVAACFLLCVRRNSFYFLLRQA